MSTTAGSVYGTAPTATTTPNTTYITQLTVTGTLTAGVYFVFASCATGSNTANRYSDTQLTIDGASVSTNWVNHVVVTNTTQSTFMEVVTLTAGSHTFALQFRRSTTNNFNATISCSDAFLAAIRIF